MASGHHTGQPTARAKMPALPSCLFWELQEANSSLPSCFPCLDPPKPTSLVSAHFCHLLGPHLSPEALILGLPRGSQHPGGGVKGCHRRPSGAWLCLLMVSLTTGEVTSPPPQPPLRELGPGPHCLIFMILNYLEIMVSLPQVNLPKQLYCSGAATAQPGGVGGPVPWG